MQTLDMARTRTSTAEARARAPHGPTRPPHVGALGLQRAAGNRAVTRLLRSTASPSRDTDTDTDTVQRYAYCSPARPSGLDCPKRVAGEVATARSGPMAFASQLRLDTGETGALIANFDIGSAAIKGNLASTLEWKQFLGMVGAPGTKYKIVGFTDCQGKEGGNKALRDKRANAALAALPKAVRANISSVQGADVGQCITENDEAADRTLNRSVAFILEQSTMDFEAEEITDTLERKEPPTESCSTDQRKHLAVAYPLAKRIGEDAMAAIGRMTKGSPEERLLRKYFGPDAWKERFHIRQGYRAALGAFRSSPTYECVPAGQDPCTGGTVGYANAHAIVFGSPIKVCPSAFGDDLELADTILHEASHVGDQTNDAKYCTVAGGCDLPTSDEILPGIGLGGSGALQNADSYSRFASAVYLSQ